MKNFVKTGPMKLPSRIARGTFDLYLFEFIENKYFTLEKGDIMSEENPLVRIESNCVWAHIFGSARCDCGEQLHESMKKIIEEGSGLLIQAYNQDGRGLSLRDHVRVYMEQDKGYDTVEADRRCGFENPDRRDYSEIIQILGEYKINKCRLLTNNPHRISILEKHGIEITRVPLEAVIIDKYNAAQLYTKKTKLDHDFSFDTSDPEIIDLFINSVKKDSFSEYEEDL